MSNYSTFIGVDPGASGGIVSISPGQGEAPFLARFAPKTEGEIWKVVQGLSEPKGSVVAIIEKVGGFIGRVNPGYVGNRQPGSHMFNFGVSYGNLRMALVASGTPFEAVHPKTWQAYFKVPSKKEIGNQTAWKNYLKEIAQKLFPYAKMTLATADATLLAYYCWAKFGQENSSGIG